MHMANALSRAHLSYQHAMKGCKNMLFAVDTRSKAGIEAKKINAVRTVNVSSRSIKEIVK